MQHSGLTQDSIRWWAQDEMHRGVVFDVVSFDGVDIEHMGKARDIAGRNTAMFPNSLDEDRSGAGQMAASGQ